MTHQFLTSEISIRTYQSTDEQIIKAMIIQLQDFESSLEKDRIKGSLVGESYFSEMIANCNHLNGNVFVLCHLNEVIGFIAVYIIEEKETISKIDTYGYISDIFIDNNFRWKGLSKLLFDTACEYFKEKKLKYMKVCALAENSTMIHTCESRGFKKHEIMFLKEI